jgi:NTP pyrophosphatase (non-canonical NTP hydrolase)
VIDERRRELAKVRDERVPKRVGRILESNELESIKPEAAAVFADVGIHAAKAQVSEGLQAARAVERDGSHGFGFGR